MGEAAIKAINTTEDGDHIETVTVDKSLIDVVHETAAAMLRAAAEIHNMARIVERCSSGANDPMIIDALAEFRRVAGDLSEAWDGLDFVLSVNNLPDIR